jgi:hypothetical protein
MGTALSLVERNACVIGMFDWWITLRMADKMLQLCLRLQFTGRRRCCPWVPKSLGSKLVAR